MTKYTEVVNETDVIITLKQGSAGVYSVVGQVQPKKTYRIRVDESATYREYWCAVQPTPDPDQENVVFSSDDCIEFKKVRIYEVGHQSGRYKWEGISRQEISKPAKPLQPTQAELAQAASPQQAQALSTQQDHATPSQQAQAASTPNPTPWKRFTNLFK
jgi:hypothetical protein